MTETHSTATIRVTALTAEGEAFAFLDGLETPEGRVEFVGLLDPGQDVVEQLRRLQPDLLYLDGDDPEIDAINWTEQVTVANLPVGCILVWAEEDTRRIRHAMRAGAEDFVIKPLDPTQVATQCAEVTSVIRERSPLGWGTGAPPAGPHYCQVTGLVCGKAGVGKTTIAVNLAVVIASELNRRTAVVDLQPGYAAVLLNVKPPNELQSLLEMVDDLDVETIRALGVDHDSGVRIYSWQRQPDFHTFRTLSPEFLQAVLQLLAGEYDHILVLFPHLAGERSLGALAIMDELLVITTSSDLLTLRDTKILLDTLETDYMDADKIRIVLNRHGKTSSFSREDVERTLRRPISGVIPSDSEVTSAAINMGIPFVTLKPSSPVTQSTRELAATLTGAELTTRPAESRRFLGVFGYR